MIDGSIRADSFISFMLHNFQIMSYEPEHDKTNKMNYVPSKDSDQPGWMPCPVWSVFAIIFMGSYM